LNCDCIFKKLFCAECSSAMSALRATERSCWCRSTTPPDTCSTFWPGREREKGRESERERERERKGERERRGREGERKGEW
jgi:hypothetical protein